MTRPDRAWRLACCVAAMVFMAGNAPAVGARSVPNHEPNAAALAIGIIALDSVAADQASTPAATTTTPTGPPITPTNIPTATPLLLPSSTVPALPLTATLAPATATASAAPSTPVAPVPTTATVIATAPPPPTPTATLPLTLTVVAPAPLTATPTESVAEPTATGTPLPTVPVRAGGRVHVAPERVVAGGDLEVAVAGFGERERLAVWVTDAVGRVTGDGDQTATRDGEAFFTIVVPSDATSGQAAVTVRGHASQRQAVAAFVVETATGEAEPAPQNGTSASAPALVITATEVPQVATPSPTETATATPSSTATATVTRTPAPDNRDIAGLLPPGSPGGALSPRLARTYFGNAARVSGVPVEVLLAVAAVESGFRPNAVGPYLPQFAGTIDEHALGMMQFLPSTYQYYVRRVDRLTGKNLGLRGIWDPESAVYAAALYLSDSGAPADMRRALFRYNNAEWYVRLVLAWSDYYAAGGTLGGAPVVDVARLPDLPSPSAIGGATPEIRSAGPPSLADAAAPRPSALPEGLLELLGQLSDRMDWPRLQVGSRPLPN